MSPTPQEAQEALKQAEKLLMEENFGAIPSLEIVAAFIDTEGERIATLEAENQRLRGVREAESTDVEGLIEAHRDACFEMGMRSGRQTPNAVGQPVNVDVDREDVDAAEAALRRQLDPGGGALMDAYEDGRRDADAEADAYREALERLLATLEDACTMNTVTMEAFNDAKAVLRRKETTDAGR